MSENITEDKSKVETKSSSKEHGSNRSLAPSGKLSEKTTNESMVKNSNVTIADMKSQLEIIRKNIPRQGSNNKINSNSNSIPKRDEKKSRKSKIDSGNKVISKSGKGKDVSDKMNIDNKSNNKEDDSKEIFYSCSSEIPMSGSSVRSSIALSDTEIDRLNKKVDCISKSTSTNKEQMDKNGVKNIIKKVVDNKSLKDNKKHDVRKDKDKLPIKEIKKKDDERSNETTPYTVTYPEDVIHYNVSKEVPQNKYKTNNNIGFVNTGTLINQSFINLSSSDMSQPETINKIKRSFQNSIPPVHPIIRSITPKIKETVLSQEQSQTFIRKGDNSPWIKKQITPSLFDYEAEKDGKTNVMERFEIVDETSMTEEDGSTFNGSY
uniref:WH2 domain-containing protein n=1 Tax=Parastrongyloides trichosuri TaxID=131310 RepID=A0A0N4ZMX5_PARTI